MGGEDGLVAGSQRRVWEEDRGDESRRGKDR